MQNTPNSFNTMENNQTEYNCPLNIITKWDEVILQRLQAKSEEREHSTDENSWKEWRKSGIESSLIEQHFLSDCQGYATITPLFSELKYKNNDQTTNDQGNPKTILLLHSP